MNSPKKQTQPAPNSMMTRLSYGIRQATSNQAVSMLSILAVMWLIMSFASPFFLTVNNVMNISLQAAQISLIAAGMTFVILSGGIDLSVGSVFALSAVAAGLASKAGLPWYIIILVGVVTGAIAGSLNGLGVGYLKLPPFVVTLGMMGAARGIALIIVQGIPIVGNPENGFETIGVGKLGGVVPVPTLIVLLIYAICYFILRRTRFGHFTYSIGSNPEATRLAGVRTSRYLVGIYALCGALTALASLIEAGRLNSFQPAGGQGLELDAIGAVVIGGASLFGGEGNILASLIGALIVVTIRNSLNLLGVYAFWQYVVTGALIVFAVYLDSLRRKR